MNINPKNPRNVSLEQATTENRNENETNKKSQLGTKSRCKLPL